MLAKLLSYLPKNLTAILGIIQAVIKFGKELCTLIIDLLCPIIPGDGDTILIEKIRGIFNTLDGWIEKIKEKLLSI